MIEQVMEKDAALPGIEHQRLHRAFRGPHPKRIGPGEAERVAQQLGKRACRLNTFERRQQRRMVGTHQTIMSGDDWCSAC